MGTLFLPIGVPDIRVLPYGPLDIPFGRTGLSCPVGLAVSAPGVSDPCVPPEPRGRPPDTPVPRGRPPLTPVPRCPPPATPAPRGRPPPAPGVIGRPSAAGSLCGLVRLSLCLVLPPTTLLLPPAPVLAWSGGDDEGLVLEVALLPWGFPTPAAARPRWRLSLFQKVEVLFPQRVISFWPGAEATKHANWCTFRN